METKTDTQRLSWLIKTGNYSFVDHENYGYHANLQIEARERIDEAMGDISMTATIEKN